ncbi:NAD(P)H-binding protein [Chryseobacterium sp. SIMBA_028]|uniref:NmrA family NAD(P)-binding protein n=1 Tax=Chryseobacterium sp. SIMBA_028 TaxID=3085771 RepID=UPI003979FC70
MNENILVIGGEGKNGRRVVEKFRNIGFSVFSTTRTKEEVKTGLVFFDWNDGSTYEPAVSNIDKVYIVHPDTSVPDAYEQINLLMSCMEKKGVSKAVLLSGRGQESVRKCEGILINSPLKWTIIRSAWFNQNFSEGHFLHGIQSGSVTFMAGSAKEPFVDLDDLSDAVVECLLHEKYNGKIYEVTGDELFTFEEAVKTIGNRLGRDIKYHFLNKKEYSDLLKNIGLPHFVAEHMAVAFDEILDGRNENTGSGIQEILGRSPKKFKEFVKLNAFN